MREGPEKVRRYITVSTGSWPLAPDTMTNKLCRSVVRFLDVLNTLPVDQKLQVHEKLVSYLTNFDTQFDILTLIPEAYGRDIITFGTLCFLSNLFLIRT